MSEELVRRATELMNRNDLAPDEELEELFTPDVVIDLNARVFNPKVYEGYDGLREFYAESREVWEQVTLTVHEILTKGDRYVVLGEGRSRGRGSGMEISSGFTGMWTVENERLTHYVLLSTTEADRELAIAALRAQSGI